MAPTEATQEQQVQQQNEIVLTEDKGVIKRILVPAAEGAESPLEEDEVSVHYVGTLLDGTKFDSSRDRDEPFKFKLGTGQVIKGWDIGVASMKKGEKAILTCKPEYAYGKAGSPPKIPSNATLQFEVELLSWESDNDLTNDGGILKKVLKKGQGESKPYTGYEVTVHYVGKFLDGKIFDSSRDRNQPITFNVSEDESIPECFHKGVKEMKKGEILQLTVKPRYAFGEEGNAKLGVPPNTTVIYELELLEMCQIDRIQDGAVLKKKIKEGSGYKRPNDGSKVQLKYTLTVEGAPAPLVSLNVPTEFVLGSGTLPEALDLALPKMDKGEVARVTTHDSDFLFSAEENKKRGFPVGKQKFIFDVELVDFEKAKESWDMDFTEKMETAKVDKEAGNTFFKAGRFRQAKSKYKKALSSLESDYKFTEEEKKQAKEFKLSLYLNLAAVKLKVADYKEVIQNCNKALEIEKENPKALFRRAQAKFNLGDLEAARKDLVVAAHGAPNDKEIRNLLKDIDSKIKASIEKEKKVFSGMFEKLSQLEEKEAKKIKKEEPAPAAQEPVKMEE